MKNTDETKNPSANSGISVGVCSHNENMDLLKMVAFQNTSMNNTNEKANNRNQYNTRKQIISL